ncbi:hydantoinase/oxoprolinase family protein [Haloplanus pelagicus]|uniref:hydantoinase/oxoprolinase family protein n=1 Tax=Haloplanus pelagicus TaxID=2949995 RepID=UPI00203D2668|nr:hydantoinase/oxoprolinase family protein [Haloplanus sp. HW8-1]
MVDYEIGTDIGGTHTDTVVLTSGGEQYIAKAPSTPDDFSVGVLDSLRVVCSELGVDLEELLANTTRFVNGSTVATNTIAELQGAETGLITTKGFEDTLKIARSPREVNVFDLHEQTGPPEIVEKPNIVGVPERIDYTGDVVVPLDREAAEAAVDELVAADVDTIAVCLLWSFENSAHEELIGEIIETKYPEMHYSLSHQIFPVIREYERMTTTVFNSYAGPSVVQYTENLRERLGEHGLSVPILIMHSEGGYTSVEEAKERPVSLVSSGPAAGVIGANELGKQLGVENIITADMGGTSFDTSLIHDNEIRMRTRARIGDFDTGLHLVDVEAIGSGGGSIAWIDERGQPNVGPRSAGADPGPVCYGRGGTDPTVTDAALALGYLNPEYFLGGRDTLDFDAARTAIAERIAEPLDQSVEQAAVGILTLTVAKMSNAARSVSIEKGYDPRNFSMMAFGGTSPLFATWICEELDIDRIVIPDDAASFSAHGLLEADHKRSYVETYHSVIDEETIADLATLYESMEAQAREDFETEGQRPEDVEFDREIDLRFAGQASELTISLPQRDLSGVDPASLESQFVDEYETLYGEGTAWEDAPVEVQNVRLDAVVPIETHDLRRADTRTGTDRTEPTQRERRTIHLPMRDETREVPVYDGRTLAPGFELEETAIIEKPYTTVFLPPAARLHVDDRENIVIERN